MQAKVTTYERLPNPGEVWEHRRYEEQTILVAEIYRGTDGELYISGTYGEAWRNGSLKGFLENYKPGIIVRREMES